MRNADGKGNPIVFLKIACIIGSPEYDLQVGEVQEIFANRDRNGLKEHFIQFGNRMFVRKIEFDKFYKTYRKESASYT
jgi:hypothetical protein